MKSGKLLILVLLFFSITGCYARMQETLRDDHFKPIKFNTDEKVAVMLSGDGVYKFSDDFSDENSSLKALADNTKLYLGSGIAVANKVQAALLSIFSEVEMFNTKNKEKAIHLSKRQKVKYLVVPAILHWEDRNTPWSGVADKIEVKIEVFDMKTDKMVNNIIFKANNEWATLSDKPPEDLLDNEFNKAIIDMFSREK